jgi:hypothetical protein
MAKKRKRRKHATTPKMKLAAVIKTLHAVKNQV